MSRGKEGQFSLRCADRSDQPLSGNFRTRADSIINNRARLSGGRKKFNVKFIVNMNTFLYNIRCERDLPLRGANLVRETL